MKQENRLIYIYGRGKGKTTSAIGQAIRIAGGGKKVLFISFFKGGFNSGESVLLGRIKNISYVQLLKYNDINLLKKADIGGIAGKILRGKSFDAVILDELTVGLHYKIFNTAEVRELIRRLLKHSTVVITGRFFIKWIENIAGISSEVVEKKHCYRSGIKTQKGIEF